MTEEKKRRRRTTPIKAKWDGECFIPANHEMAWCDKNLVVDQVYFVRAEEEQKTFATKYEQAFHAEVGLFYDHLPPKYQSWFKSADHLRHFMLIQNSYCWVEQWHMVTEDEADKYGRGRRSVEGRSHDPFVVYTRDQGTVTILEAYSMAHHPDHRGRISPISPVDHPKEFREACEKLRRYMAEELGVTLDELADGARNNA